MTDQVHTPPARLAPAPLSAEAWDHAAAVVDALIEERAGRWPENPLLWRLVRAGIDPMFGYRKAVALTAAIAPLSSEAVMAHVDAMLQLQVQVEGLEHIPREGPLVVVANHPGGIADGVAVWRALKDARPDLCFFANRDAWRVSAGLEQLVIPVEWRDDARTREKTRETVKHATKAFRAGRAVVIFPTGRIAHWQWLRRGPDGRRLWPGTEEPDWQPSALALARKYDAPIVPLGVRARMSSLYYALQYVSESLRHMTVFHELLNKRGARYRLRFGPGLAPDAWTDDLAGAVADLRARSLALAWGH